MSAKYEQVISGEWWPLPKTWDLQCCSCGLVHEVSIRVKDGQAQICMTVNARATAQVRRHRRNRNGRKAKDPR